MSYPEDEALNNFLAPAKCSKTLVELKNKDRLSPGLLLLQEPSNEILATPLTCSPPLAQSFLLQFILFRTPQP